MATSISKDGYYVKKAVDDGLEIIVADLAHICGINTPEYKLVNKDGINYYYSKDLNYLGRFNNLNEYNISSFNVDTIGEELTSLFPNSDVFDQLFKIYIFNLLIINGDCVPKNIGVLVNKDITLYSFDHELAFDYEWGTPLSIIPHGFKAKEIDVPKGTPRSIRHNLKEISYLIDNMYDSYIDMFISMFSELTPKVVEGVVKGVEATLNHEIQAKNVYLRIYDNYYQEIIKLLEKRGYTCGERISKN